MDFLPAGEMHSLEIDALGIRSFSIEIGPRWVDRAYDCSIALNRSVHSHGGGLAQMLLKLYYEFRQMDEVSPLAIEGLVLELLAEMSRSQVKTKKRLPPLWLGRAEEFLRAHFSEHLSLDTVSEAVGVHAVHLAREFRRHYRCTAGEYVRRLRIEYACNEIAGSSSSLAEIASAAGFSDQSHFSRVFKRFTHMTPGEYKAALSAR